MSTLARWNELLRHATPDQIHAMARPASIERLWTDTGGSPEELRARLAQGTPTTQLLLELLREHGVAELWGMLPEDLRKPETGEEWWMRKLRGEPGQRLSRVEAWGAFAGAVIVVGGVMWARDAHGALSLGMFATTMLGASLMAAMFARPRSAGVLGGLVGGLVVVVATWAADRLGLPRSDGMFLLLGLLGLLVGTSVTIPLVRRFLESTSPTRF